jgi:hypothetical protein
MKEADTSHPSLADLAAFDAGHLSAAEREGIERHLARCPECGRRMDALPEDPFVALVRAAAVKAGADRPTPDMRAAPPSDLPAPLAAHPRYRILEALGAGGMGTVYKAVHRLMDRVVALKVLHRRFSDDPDFVARFRREVRAAARLIHPHIVLAHDAEQAGDLHLLVMEYVPGTSLDRVVARRGPLPIEDACACVLQAALGLQHAHEHGLVHRDVKPANLMLTPAGQVKVLDFGLARLAAAGVDETATPLPSAAVVGTPDYTAPEQARDPRAADVRADVYGLGCTLWFLLTGQPPFPGGTALQKLLAHQDRSPRPITELRGDVPAALADLLGRMLAKDPARRPATPAAVARELAPFAGAGAAEEPKAADSRTESGRTCGASAPPSPPARRWPWLLAAAVLLAGVGVAGFVAFGRRGGEPAVETPPPVEGPAEPAERPRPPSPAPAVALALATPEQMTRLRKQRRDQALAWLRDNNRWGPRASIVERTAATFQHAGDADGFLLMLGGQLLRTQQPALLAGHLGGFFVFPLDAAQARALDLPPTKCSFRDCRKAADLYRATPRVRLSGLKIDHPEHIDPDKRVTGSVAYEVTGPTVAPPFAIRLSFYLEKAGRRMVALWSKRQTLEGSGRLQFNCPPLGTREIRPRGPLILFAEICTDPDALTVVESNTAAVLVEVRP